jgi:choline-sulfatase
MSFLTGRYVHQIGAWDNGSPLRPEIPTMGTYLEAAGYRTVLCGRTHLLGPDRLHGFGSRLVDDMGAWQRYEQLPIRDPGKRRLKGDSHVTECGPGMHAYQEYDRTVADAACRYLQAAACNTAAGPWLLYVGFMLPHFPLIAPPGLFEHYFPNRIQLPDPAPPVNEQHPAIRQLRVHHCNDGSYPEDLLRRALASYYALITLTDRRIGGLLNTLRERGLAETTVVIYISDHGEMAGRKGLWQKMCFYEPSARVPLIVRGPGWPRGRRVAANVSLVDILPTLLDLAGAPVPPELPGASLLSAERTAADDNERLVFGEYHGQGGERASYMIRKEHHKYIHHLGLEPQLFDLESDPEEREDLVGQPGTEGLCRQLHGELQRIADPEETDERARANQKLFGLQRVY